MYPSAPEYGLSTWLPAGGVVVGVVGGVVVGVVGGVVVGVVGGVLVVPPVQVVPFSAKEVGTGLDPL
jgi:hypothetical protein